MTKTNEELRDAVAEYLRVKGADYELSDVRADQIDRGIDEAFAELRELTLCWWPSDAIPDACIFSLKQIIAAQLCTAFGKAGQGYEAGDEAGRVRLAKLKQSTDIGTVAAVYF